MKTENFYASILLLKLRFKILSNNEFYTIFRSNLAMENERNSVAVSNGHHYMFDTFKQKEVKKKNEENNLIPYFLQTTSRRESERITGWIESVIMTVSQTSIGQALFKFIDSFLWVVEKSTQWSLPAHEIAAGTFEQFLKIISLVNNLITINHEII